MNPISYYWVHSRDIKKMKCCEYGPVCPRSLNKVRLMRLLNVYAIVAANIARVNAPSESIITF